MYLFSLKHVGVDWKSVYRANVRQTCSELLGIKCYLNLDESEEPWQQGKPNLHACGINKPPSTSAINEKLLPVALALFITVICLVKNWLCV